MYSKSLLIAIAAFAVTTSGAQAFMGLSYAQKAGLTTTQTAAFSQARDLRMQGKKEEARDVLLAAGIDEKAVAALREAAKAAHSAIEKALMEQDFEAFKVAVSGTPLADIITTERDFKQFSEAVDLRKDGQHAEASELFAELGVEAHGPHGYFGKKRHHDVSSKLSATQRDAFTVAKQANDRETMDQILREAGVEPRPKHGFHQGE